MKGLRQTALALGLALAIAVAHSMASAASGQAPADPAWHPPGCPPPAETTRGPSSITVTGPCAFEHTGEAECEWEGDDFPVTATRKAKNSAEIVLFVNVERFVGPRTYKPPNDLYVSLKVGSKIYRWSTNNYEATVGPGSKFVTFKDVKLEAEPVLVGCTGPQTNYQCDGRGDDPKHEASMSVVSGTIYCKAARAKKS